MSCRRSFRLRRGMIPVPVLGIRSHLSHARWRHLSPCWLEVRSTVSLRDTPNTNTDQILRVSTATDSVWGPLAFSTARKAPLPSRDNPITARPSPSTHLLSLLVGSAPAFVHRAPACPRLDPFGFGLRPISGNRNQNTRTVRNFLGGSANEIDYRSGKKTRRDKALFSSVVACLSYKTHLKPCMCLIDLGSFRPSRVDYSYLRDAGMESPEQCVSSSMFPATEYSTRSATKIKYQQVTQSKALRQ